MANEKRLIDANKLMKAIKSFRWFGVPNTLQLMFDYLKIIIRDQPTVDAVEVVRCKNCHNCTMSNWCNLLMMRVNEDWFCSHGKRRHNDNDHCDD